MAACDYSNHSKIFREITTLKFQGQHGIQFNRYEGLCPATKIEIHRRFSNGILRDFRAASFENNFGGLLLKRKQRWGRTRSEPLVSGFHFSRTVIYLLSHEAMYFLCKFSHRIFSTWIMLSIFIYLRKGLVVQFLRSRFWW